MGLKKHIFLRRLLILVTMHHASTMLDLHSTGTEYGFGWASKSAVFLEAKNQPRDNESMTELSR